MAGVVSSDEEGGGGDYANAVGSSQVRRRWHVPKEHDVTTPPGSAAKVPPTTTTKPPPDVEQPQQESSSSRRALFGSRAGPATEDEALQGRLEDGETKSPSEAVLFASEVKRFSKQSLARGTQQIRKKLHRFFVDNPAYGADSEDEDEGEKKKKRRGAMAVFWIQLVLPCVAWLRTYKVRSFLAADIIAGLSVAMMVVPQSISYAALAGLPSEFGLYTALLPVFVYAVFGSSRQLAVGPVAIVSLLMKEGLHKAIPASLAIQDPNNPQGDDQLEAQQQYNLMAVQITFVVGLIEVVMGLLRLGFLTNFLSHSVILGFTHGSAILIGLSQLKHVIGIKAGNAKGTLQDMIKAYSKAGGTFDWRVLVMGLSFLAILVAMKETGKRADSRSPLKWLRTVGPLTVSVLGIAICYGARLDTYGIPLVGKFKGGFPDVTYGKIFPLSSEVSFITTSFSCAIVGLLESVSIAKRLAAKNKYHLYPNQELRALGMSNLVGAGFSAYPATGSFSRSAVSNDTGCKTQLGGCVTAVIVLVTVLFITKPFYYMPMSGLGAIVISGVLGLLDFEEALYLFRMNKVDFLVWMASFLGTLFLGAELGLAIAIGLALLFVIYESAFPPIVELGRLQGTTVYRSLKQYPHAKRLPSVVILRVGAPIYFANCSYVREMFEYFVEKHERLGQTVKVVIMEMSPVSHVDATAMHALNEMMEDFVENRNLKFMIANPNQQVVRSLQHDRKVWAMLNPGEGVAGNLRAFPEELEDDSSTLRDRENLYYGSHDSNLFVRVHDAVKESALYCCKENGKDLGDFDENSRQFFEDLPKTREKGSRGE
ncbi:sulfate permease [Chloropicon primus]|nr:sulfate permease [Chloropicon primus]